MRIRYHVVRVHHPALRINNRHVAAHDRYTIETDTGSGISLGCGATVVATHYSWIDAERDRLARQGTP